jgi:hypothetical protein
MPLRCCEDINFQIHIACALLAIRRSNDTYEPRQACLSAFIITADSLWQATSLLDALSAIISLETIESRPLTKRVSGHTQTHAWSLDGR